MKGNAFNQGDSEKRSKTPRVWTMDPAARDQIFAQAIADGRYVPGQSKHMCSECRQLKVMHHRRLDGKYICEDCHIASGGDDSAMPSKAPILAQIVPPTKDDPLPF